MSHDPEHAHHHTPRPWLRRMRPRDPSEAHRVATPLELLFDLCFVVAIAQVAARLHHAIAEDHVGAAIPLFAMTFFAIWWAWMNFTWFASAYDTDDVPYRLLTLLQIVGVLILAAGMSWTPRMVCGLITTGARKFTVAPASPTVTRASHSSGVFSGLSSAVRCSRARSEGSRWHGKSGATRRGSIAMNAGAPVPCPCSEQNGSTDGPALTTYRRQVSKPGRPSAKCTTSGVIAGNPAATVSRWR